MILQGKNSIAVQCTVYYSWGITKGKLLVYMVQQLMLIYAMSLTCSIMELQELCLCLTFLGLCTCRLHTVGVSNALWPCCGFYTATTWPFLTHIILLLLSILYFYFSSIIGLAWVHNLLIHNYRVIFPQMRLLRQ